MTWRTASGLRFSAENPRKMVPTGAPLEPIPPAGEPIPETGPAAYQGELTFDELVSFRLELLTAALGARQHRPPPASRLPYPETTE